VIDQKLALCYAQLRTQEFWKEKHVTQRSQGSPHQSTTGVGCSRTQKGFEQARDGVGVLYSLISHRTANKHVWPRRENHKLPGYQRAVGGAH
jgi:hypothetical protein